MHGECYSLATGMGLVGMGLRRRRCVCGRGGFEIIRDACRWRRVRSHVCRCFPRSSALVNHRAHVTSRGLTCDSRMCMSQSCVGGEGYMGTRPCVKRQPPDERGAFFVITVRGVGHRPINVPVRLFPPPAKWQ